MHARRLSGSARTCNFKTGKIILTRPIEREQVVKLLHSGKTDLLSKFISKKGRPFSAYLVIGAGGKVGFEFEPRNTKQKTATPTMEAKIAKPKTRGRSSKDSLAG